LRGILNAERKKKKPRTIQGYVVKRRITGRETATKNDFPGQNCLRGGQKQRTKGYNTDKHPANIKKTWNVFLGEEGKRGVRRKRQLKAWEGKEGKGSKERGGSGKSPRDKGSYSEN